MRGKKIERICVGCGDTFQALAIKIRQGKGKYCSVDCYNDVRGRNKMNRQERERIWQIKHKYGLNEEMYRSLQEKQNHKCAICRKNMDKECVDHDHETGKVRGLLCNGCNTLLGMAKDDPEILQSAIDYLHT